MVLILGTCSRTGARVVDSALRIQTMKNLIHAAAVTLFAASTARGQQVLPYFRQIAITDQANIRAQNVNCPGFSNGSLYPLGEAAYAGVPFQHGPTDRYAFMGGYYCGDDPRALDLKVSAPGTATIYALLNAWNGCGTQGPDFVVTVSFTNGSRKTWTLANGIDYRDHNGSCPLTGTRSQEVWSSGVGQRLDLLTLPAESPGKTISHIRIESTDPWSPSAAPFVFGITIGDSQDCNGDGITDWSQCIDGTLPDYNGNSIPDCCERGEACVSGKYPVQWRLEEGGNGHWYQATPVKRGVCWEQFRDDAVLLGGYLATSTSAAENAHIYRYAMWHDAQTGPQTYLGGFQSPDACEPDCGWTWVTDEPWAYSSWADLGCCRYDEDVLELCSGIGGCGGRWRDDRACLPESLDVRAVYEWSADCNSDGIVDYGQILDGTFADVNADGIPDACQSPCIPADLNNDRSVDGADLGMLVSAWGPAGLESARADINGNGIVDGADLGILLSFWGRCTN